MSFSDLETSLQNGQPVRLYMFQRGPLKWGFTSADRAISHLSVNFKSIEGGISDDGIRQTEDTPSDTLRITTSAEMDVAKMFRHISPSQTVTLTIFDLHYGDDGYLVVWTGIVVGVKFPNDFTATLECKTLDATMEQTGLRQTWTKICPYQLYSPSCGVQRNLFRVDATISALDAVSINVPLASAKPNNWYSGGYVEWTSQYGTEQRGIELHQGAVLHLYGGTYGLSEAMNVAIYAGCDRLFATCNTKFQNTPNYGGAPHMPGKSPFDGTPII